MDDLLTPTELAEYLTVKVSTIYSWTHQKLIPHVKVGRLLRFRQKDIQLWIKHNHVKEVSYDDAEVFSRSIRCR